MDFSELSISERYNILLETEKSAEALKKYIIIGNSSNALVDFVSRQDDFEHEKIDVGISIKLGDFVFWTITLDANNKILGYLANGFGDLINALGVDFSGSEIIQNALE